MVTDLTTHTVTIPLDLPTMVDHNLDHIDSKTMLTVTNLTQRGVQVAMVPEMVTEVLEDVKASSLSMNSTGDASPYK